MAEQKKIPKDSYLFRDGDPPDAMYIIKTGNFAVTKTKGSSEITLAEVGAGAMVGEMALFDKKPRSANVRALKDSEVIALPYDSLAKQLDLLPVWVRAIMKTLNENLREANKKLRLLDNTKTDDDRFPPHITNKYISILNLVTHKYGKPEGETGSISINSQLLRNYTIQIFQEATNKMQSVVDALTDLNLLKIEDRDDGTHKIINKNPKELFEFVDWYNDWLFKQEKDRLAPITEQESAILNGILIFARKVEVNNKGLHKVDLGEIQNESMKVLGFLLRPDDVNSLIEKKYLADKIMDQDGIYLMIDVGNVESLAGKWVLVNALRKKLR